MFKKKIPDSVCPWRRDQRLAGQFHPDHPDDILVMFLGERAMELMWVQVNGFTASGSKLLSYRGTLLNEPGQLKSYRKGKAVHFDVVAGAPHPMVLVGDQKMPEIAELWLRKALVLRDVKDFPGALKCCDKSLSLRPDDANAWIVKGMTHGALKQMDKALAAFRQSHKFGHPEAKLWIQKCGASV